MLPTVCGAPGIGKTTFARKFADTPGLQTSGTLVEEPFSRCTTAGLRFRIDYNEDINSFELENVESSLSLRLLFEAIKYGIVMPDGGATSSSFVVNCVTFWNWPAVFLGSWKHSSLPWASAVLS